MVGRGPPPEGTVITHRTTGQKYVVQGGRPVPLTQQGQPSFQWRPDFGGDARELVDGTVVASSDKGQPRVLRGPTMGQEQRSRLQLSLGPGVEAEDRVTRVEAEGRGRPKLGWSAPGGVFSSIGGMLGYDQRTPLGREWGAAVVGGLPGGIGDDVARRMGGQEYQDYDQAAATLESMLLPIFSGLAVTESEAARYVRANAPRPGDSAETLRSKARNRQMVFNAGAKALGQALPFPEVGIYGEENYMAGRQNRAQRAGPPRRPQPQAEPRVIVRRID